MSAPTLTATQSLVGSFTAEAFATHLATQSAAPAWWLERKRAAYNKFAAVPTRKSESWRFSAIGTLTLEGFEVGCVIPDAPPSSAPFGPSALTFINNAIARRSALPPDLAAKGVLITTLASAAASHPDLFKAHFMAQPQKLGSEKFAALHTAFVGEGAFIYIPRGVEVAEPIVVTHIAAGAGTAVFPHTLVIAEENSKVTVVDYFASAESKPETQNADRGSFALGANDLYAGHGAQLTYIAAQNWSRDTLSFQLNSTVVRRDARVQSLNLHLGARQARHESLSQLQAPGAFSEMLALTVAEGAQEFDQRTLQLHQAPNTKTPSATGRKLFSRASSSSIPTRRKPTPTKAIATSCSATKPRRIRCRALKFRRTTCAALTARRLRASIRNKNFICRPAASPKPPPTNSSPSASSRKYSTNSRTTICTRPSAR
jgi:Fe-S cluster assembly protein SufD